ncbi:MAG TPA: biosynthetic arginine decarboxylase [Gammaproteobacteria bacterium]
MSEWSIDKAQLLYNVAHWGSGYFAINSAGHLAAHPDRDLSRGIDLYRLVHQAQAEGLRLPLLVRFTGILRDRVQTLVSSFARAIDNEAYEGRYTALYPIKVNQQRHVVEELLRGGGEAIGLEAGSKPELMAVLAMVPHGGVIVCNGYKDPEYIRLALIGKAMGHRIYIVIEKPGELDHVLAEAKNLGIEPLLGVRLRLASIGAGMWQNSGGEKSKFGLSSSQLLQAIELLREHGMLHCLTLLHCHLGSQIANIRDIQRGMHELARYYAQLHAMGIALQVLEVGGGLGIDYEGSRSRSACSINYSVQEYANDVVHAIKEICTVEGLPQPDIFSESGRAMTAHHAALITDVIDSEQVARPAQIGQPSAEEPLLLHNLWYGLESLRRHPSGRSVAEAYHDALHWLGEAQGLFAHGLLDLEQRARAEALYFATCWAVLEQLPTGARAHREILDDLTDKLADKYFGNFSLFQSLPDVWAIEQVFPIMPIHRLDEKPSRRGVLHDITCDSDGRIDHYVSGAGLETTLALHPLHANEPYLLGMFLVGAYQEILGDLHNLFGDTDAVNVELNEDGSFHMLAAQPGESVAQVLRHVQFDAAQLLERYRAKLARSGLSAAEQTEYMEQLQVGMAGYTYLEE